MDRIIATLVIIVFIFVLAVVAHGAPPVDADPAMAEWFGSLKNKAGMSCCNLADCRRTDYRFGRLGIEAVTPGGDWVLVPNDTVLPRTDNPTGFGVLCWNGSRVLCFVRAAEG